MNNELEQWCGSSYCKSQYALLLSLSFGSATSATNAFSPLLLICLYFDSTQRNDSLSRQVVTFGRVVFSFVVAFPTFATFGLLIAQVV